MTINLHAMIKSTNNFALNSIIDIFAASLVLNYLMPGIPNVIILFSSNDKKAIYIYIYIYIYI